MFRNHQTEEAVARKAANGTLRIIPGGYEEATAAVVELWEARRTANQARADFSITLSAPTNFDAHNVSLAIRRRRRELGGDQGRGGDGWRGAWLLLAERQIDVHGSSPAQS